MNFDGLKDAVVGLLAGIRKRIIVDTFTNDMVTFNRADDVLTLLIHLGYLGYDAQTKEVFIPNKEVRSAFLASIRYIGWEDIQTFDD
jgi:hypothetical protein